MNSIKTVIIENFQSHVKTNIELAPNGQLTVITGPTDSGKSAIFRAIKWLLYNSPQGSDFMRAGSTFCRVTFEMESGHIIIREMTASKNQYRIVAPGAEKPIVLEGFGRSVPVEVQEITGVKTVTIGDDEFILNLAEQLDGPFLGKSISAPGRAKIIGKLAGTEVLDHAGKQAGTDLYRKNQEEKQLSADIDLLIETIATFDYLPKLADKITALDSIVADVKAKQDRLNSLKSINHNLSQLKVKIDCCNNILDGLKFIDAAESIISDVATKTERASSLSKHQINLIVANVGIMEAQDSIKRLESVAVADSLVSNIDLQLAKFNKLATIWGRLKLFETSINTCSTTIKILSNIEKVDSAIQETVSNQDKLNKLMDSRLKIHAMEFSINQNNETIQRLKNINQVEPVMKLVSEKIEQLVNLQNVNDSIKKLNITIDALSKNVISREQQVLQLEADYQKELTALGVCPLCGNVFVPKAS